MDTPTKDALAILNAKVTALELTVADQSSQLSKLWDRLHALEDVAPVAKFGKGS